MSDPNIRKEAERRYNEYQRQGKQEHERQKNDSEKPQLQENLRIHQIELEMQHNELTQTRNKLEDLVEKYSDLYDFAPVGYFTLDENGKINEVNLRGAKMLGTEREYIVGNSFSTYLHTEDLVGFRELRKDIFLKPGQASLVVKLKPVNNEHFFAKLIGTSLMSDIENNRLIRLVVMDVDKQERMEMELQKKVRALEQREKELQNAKQEVEKAAAAKKAFISNMSHEIRTPLNGIIGFSEILEEEQSQPENKQMLRSVRYAAQGLLSMIEDILEYSQISEENFKINKENFSINAVLRSAASIIKQEASKKNIQFVTSFSGNWPELVCGDQNRFLQILLHLLGNAVKFTSQGSVKLSVFSKTSEGTLNLVVKIEDSGIGIPADRLRMIFDVFRQSDDTKQRKHGGLGIGLSITKTLVERMGGTIQVNSEEGVGSIFTVSLPFESAEQKSVAAQSKAQNQRKMLVVEDNSINGLVIQRYLANKQIQAKMASSGVQAIAMLSTEDFDGVLMDIEMPEMDGIEAVKRIREGEAEEKNKDIPVIALTAHAFADMKEEALQAGMNGFLTKPIDVMELNRMIDEQLSIASDNGTDEQSLVDFETARNRLQAEDHFIRKLMNKFVDQVPDHLGKIDRSLSERDFASYSRVLHSIKGSAGNLGLVPLEALAKELELSARNQEQAAFQRTEEIRDLLRKTIEEIQDKVSEEN
ncbi:MAG: response regulator [Spirochaetales bacterium]|nr:response regulator [Spirochaetales bacterium]